MNHGRTVKNRTSEEHEELDEQVLLVGGDLVPAKLLAARLDIRRGDTLADVGGEPLIGDGSVLSLDGSGFALLPELWGLSVFRRSQWHVLIWCYTPAMASSSGIQRGCWPAPPAERAWGPCRWKCTFAERCTRLD